MADYVFFTNEDTRMKLLLREQMEQVCRQVLARDVILSAIQGFDFGYARVLPVAMVGQRRRQHVGDELSLKSGILVTTNFVDHTDEWYVELICSRGNTGDGADLMNLVETRARHENIRKIALHCIGEDRLHRWYQRQGYVDSKKLMLPTGDIKGWLMVKNLV